MTWTIHPDKKGDLHYDDWHLGFRDYNGPLKHPKIAPYVAGWNQHWGMEDGYSARPPQSNNADYRRGYEDAAYERWCHLGAIPCDQPCNEFMRTAECDCSRG